MVKHTRVQYFYRLFLVTLGILLFCAYCTPTRAATGTISGNVASGSSSYYRVGGWTNYAYFQITFLSSFNLQLRLYDDSGNIIATGTTTSSTTRQIYEYLSGGYTYYVVITYLSGTGAASFTLDYQDVYTITYYGNTSPFPLGNDPLLALAIGAPIIIGIGFAIIGIFGRMKLRPRKTPISGNIPSPYANLFPGPTPSQPSIQASPPKTSLPASGETTPEIGPTIKYCPFCGSDVPPGSTTCQRCGNPLN